MLIFNQDEFLNKLKRIRESFFFFLHECPLAAAGIFFLVSLGLYAGVYWGTLGISFQDDHFFHFKLAYLLRTEGFGILNNFDWIYLTKTAQEHLRYPISLFQIALVPFTFFKDMVLGLKVSDIFWASLSVSIIFYVLLKMKTKFPIFSMLVLLSSFVFFFRMMIGRPLVLTVGLVFLEIYLASGKKYKQFFLVSLLHVLWHPSTLFFPIAIALIATLSQYLVEKKIRLKIIFSGLGAFLLGSLLLGTNYLVDFFKSMFFVVQKTSEGIKEQGTELYTLDVFKIIERSEIFFILFALSLALVFYLYMINREKNSQEKSPFLVTIFSLFFFCLFSFSGMILISGRFHDYFFPSVVLLFFALLTFLLEKSDLEKKPLFRVLLLALVFVFVLKMTGAFLDSKKEISAKDFRPLAEVADWIKDNSQEKDRVFLADWSDFTIAFFYNDKNVYSMGIEPTALWDYDSSLYWKWYNIRQNNYYCEKQVDCTEEAKMLEATLKQKGEEAQNAFLKENSRKIISSIKNDFGAKFVIADENLSKTLNYNPEMIENSFKKESEYGNSVYRGIKLK